MLATSGILADSISDDVYGDALPITNDQPLLDVNGTETLTDLPAINVSTDIDTIGIDQFSNDTNTTNQRTDAPEHPTGSITLVTIGSHNTNTSNGLLNIKLLPDTSISKTPNDGFGSSNADIVTKSHAANYQPLLDANEPAVAERLGDLLATSGILADSSSGSLVPDIHQFLDATTSTNPLDAVGLCNVSTELGPDKDRAKQSTDTSEQPSHTITSKELFAAKRLPSVNTSIWLQSTNPLLDDQRLVEGPTGNETLNDLLVTEVDAPKDSLAPYTTMSSTSINAVERFDTFASGDSEFASDDAADAVEKPSALLNWLFNTNQSPASQTSKFDAFGSSDAITANKSPGANDEPFLNVKQSYTETLDDLSAATGSTGVDTTSTLLAPSVHQLPDTFTSSSSLDVHVAGLFSVNTGSPSEYTNTLNELLPAHQSSITDALDGLLNTNRLTYASVPIDEYDANIAKTLPYTNDQPVLDGPTGNESLSDLHIANESAGKHASSESLATDTHPMPDATVDASESLDTDTSNHPADRTEDPSDTNISPNGLHYNQLLVPALIFL